MIQPTESAFNRPLAVRDGRGAPVTCSACGCRLEGDPASGAWFHFSPLAGRDARGCLVACADLVHDQTGRARSPSVS